MCHRRKSLRTVRNKHEKLERKGEASFDTPFMIQSHAESMKTIVGDLPDLQANVLGCGNKGLVFDRNNG